MLGLRAQLLGAQAPGKKLYASFEEAVAATEALQRAPAVTPAHSGNDFYTSQPLQIISWYPRCTRYFSRG